MIILVKNKIGKCKCRICKSKFIYEPQDIKKRTTGAFLTSYTYRYVNCPACGEEVYLKIKN